MEQISPPMEARGTGPSTAELPTTGTDCGFPSAPQETRFPATIDNIGEASGMVASPNYPGVYWMIRDGAQNPPRHEIYAVRFDSDGMATSRAIPVTPTAAAIGEPGAFNVDWEEINYSTGPDGRGRLWIVESGQNNPWGLPADEIYEVLEPNPNADRAELLNTYEYQYPDRAYNTEASFIHRGLLVLVAKTTPHARAYRFEKLIPKDQLPVGQKNVPTYIGTFGDSKDVSVVRQSPDGKMLVTSSHQVVHMYRSTDGSGSLKSFLGRLPDCELRAFPDQNVEAGEFSSNREMVFLDELKKSFRLKIAP
jgi:hypothetical protein